MKLLIVEDEEDLALGLKRGLRKNGYEVDWTGEGREGLDLALAEDYGCVLLDLNLPGLDGTGSASPAARGEAAAEDSHFISARDGGRQGEGA